MTETVSHPIVGASSAPGCRPGTMGRAGAGVRGVGRRRRRPTRPARRGPASSSSGACAASRCSPSYLDDADATADGLHRRRLVPHRRPGALEADGTLSVRRARQGRPQGRRREHRCAGDRTGAARCRTASARWPSSGGPDAMLGEVPVAFVTVGRAPSVSIADAERAAARQLLTGLQATPGDPASSTSCHDRPSTRSPRRALRELLVRGGRSDDAAGPLAGVRVRRAGRDRAGTVLRDAARRHGRLRRPRRPGLGAERRLHAEPGHRARAPVGRRRPEVADGVRVVLDLVRDADVLLESYRPGVAERLGLGPDGCLEANPRLVYGAAERLRPGRPLGRGRRATTSTTSASPGRCTVDRACGRATGPADQPRRRPRRGSGLDGLRRRLRPSGGADQSDAARSSTPTSSTSRRRSWGSSTGCVRRACGGSTGARTCSTPAAPTTTSTPARTVGGSPSGAIEERFFLHRARRPRARADDPLRRRHKDRSRWPALREALTAAFATRTRDEWAAAFRGRRRLRHADPRPRRGHPSRAGHGPRRIPPIPGFDVPQPVVSPRFSRSRTPVPPPPPKVGADTDAVLSELGYAPERVASLREAGVLG